MYPSYLSTSNTWVNLHSNNSEEPVPDLTNHHVMESTDSEKEFSFSDTDIDTDSEDINSDGSFQRSAEATALLHFADKVTKELTTHFRRNAGQDDYCDIYENKFSAPKSGSYSYYTDLLAMAQMGDLTDNNITIGAPTFQKDASVPSICEWTCTGHRDSTLGTGPLEDLFRVLEQPSHHRFISNNQTEELRLNVDSQLKQAANVDRDRRDNCSIMTDDFHRWTNDSFSQSLSANFNEFHTAEDALY